MCTQSAYKKFVEEMEVTEKNNLFYLKNIPSIGSYETKEEALLVPEGLRNAILF